MRKVIFLTLLFSLLLAGSVLAQAATATPDSAWEQIPLDTGICARGTPYSFFVHSGDPAKLMVYFQGGGACWSADTCKPGGPFDATVTADELTRYKGIFDFSNPDNPIADYSVVVVTYCTGDVHTGSATENYAVGDKSFTIDFNGFKNAAGVLDWTYAHYDQPSELIVTGSSAGAYGAIFNAPYILAHYPDAQAVVLGDAGIGVISADWNGFDQWGTAANVATVPGYTGVKPGVDLTDSLYTAAANAFPKAAFAEYTSFSDVTQAGFYKLQGGSADQWSAGMQASLKTLDALPNFHSYVAWGGIHTALVTPLFYLMQVNGERFRDWFASLIDGSSVTDVACKNCSTPELYSGS